MDQIARVAEPDWEPGEVEVCVGDTTFGGALTAVERLTSTHTGRPLLRGELEFRTHDESESALAHELAKTAKRKHVVLRRGPLSATWRLGTYSSSFRDGRSPRSTHHHWNIEEVEAFKITELVVAGVSFHPYRYFEKIDHGALIIHARVRLTSDEAERLKALIVADDRYFEVLRRGVSDEARTMRFGQTLWSENAGAVSYLIVLVEKVYDEENQPALFEPEGSNVRMAVGSLLSAVDDLGDLLVRKGVLTEPERKAWAEGSRAKALRRSLNLWRVDDLDSWLLKHGSDEDDERSEGETEGKDN